MGIIEIMFNVYLIALLDGAVVKSIIGFRYKRNFHQSKKSCLNFVLNFPLYKCSSFSYVSAAVKLRLCCSCNTWFVIFYFHVSNLCVHQNWTNNLHHILKNIQTINHMNVDKPKLDPLATTTFPWPTERTQAQ